MDEFTREVRKFVYDTVVETTHPPIAQHVANRFQISRPEAVERSTCCKTSAS